MAGKLHHGCTTVQNSVANRKPHASSVIVSRRADLALGQQQVRREDEGRDQREGDAEPSRVDAAPELHHQREPEERQPERRPDTPAHVLLQHDERADRDEQRAEVLDQQRDPDREPVDREEVEELDECDADDAEQRDAPPLAGPSRSEPRRASDREQHSPTRRPHSGPRSAAATTRPDERATFATVPLIAEERRRDEHHRVADDRPADCSPTSPRTLRAPSAVTGRR